MSWLLFLFYRTTTNNNLVGKKNPAAHVQRSSTRPRFFRKKQRKMIYQESIDLGRQQLMIETGRLAKQADGSVFVRFGDTVVLATATANQDPREGINFFPLTVDYREYTYAAGRIPGGFFKREGRPTEKEVITSRLIDRPLRPLFPPGYFLNTQIIATVLSADQENDSAVLAINAASAALLVSDIPFPGPLAAVRVGKIGGNLVLNPTQ